MSDKSYKLRVAFSVINCICHDQRVQKIAEVVSNLDCDVTIIGRRLGSCCDGDTIPFMTKRFRMIFKKGFLFYKFFNIRLFFFLLFYKSDLLVANDLDTLLSNYLVSKLKRIPMVYDSHEYFTGVPEIQDRPFVKWVWKTIEKKIFPHLKYIMTVSNSIALQYENEYGIRPTVIRNCSRASSSIPGYTREELGINKESLLLIFQGAGINVDRGGEELIEALGNTEGVFLLIVGSGDVLPVLKEKVNQLNISDRVRFIPKLQWKELIRYTKSADAGLSLDKNTNLNYRFSLPNKLFDYISAGIPVIAGNLPEVRNIIEENDCGVIVPVITSEEISNTLKRLRDDKDYLNKLRTNSVIASKKLNWENESKKVTDFYKDVINA